MLELPTDFREFLSLLNTHHADYLLVGGYAVVLHGYPRSTGDIDLWIRTTRRNAARVLQACRDFGFDVPHLRLELFTEPKRMTRMGIPPLRIEILNSVSGLRFEDAWKRRVIRQMDGLEVPTISLADLRANKLAAGRAKDLADLENLPTQ